MTGRKRNGSLGKPVVLVTLMGLVLVGLVGLRFLYERGELNALICGGACGPEAVEEPGDLRRKAVVGATGVSGNPLSTIDESAVRATISGVLGRVSVGRHIGVAVGDLPGTVVTVGDPGTFIPASTTKLLTGLAALRELGPQTRFTTRVLLSEDRVVLVGGGDPYLDTQAPKDYAPARKANLEQLAESSARALKRLGIFRINLGYDSSLFSPPEFSPTWEAKYAKGDVVAPVSALEVDGAVHKGKRDERPAEVAVERFGAALARRGIAIGERLGNASLPGGTVIATAESGTVAQIVESVEMYSDNQGAEVLLRHVARAAGLPVTFDGGAEAVLASVAKAGVATDGAVLHDGSGLSRSNRLSPATLVSVLVAASRADETTPLFASLPVAGVSGSLAQRFGNESGTSGQVRAKTGTLTGVHSLAGLVTTRDGHLLAFAVMADEATNVNGFIAQTALDAVAAALAACTCGTSQ